MSSSDVLSFLSELVPCLEVLASFAPVSIVFLRIMVSVLRPDSYDIFWAALIPGDRTWIFFMAMCFY